MKTNNEKLKGQSYGVCAIFANEIGQTYLGAKIEEEEKFINQLLITLVFKAFDYVSKVSLWLNRIWADLLF